MSLPVESANPGSYGLLRRLFVGGMEKLKRDGQGRLAIPQHLREYAGIDREAFLDLKIARELAARLARTSIEAMPLLSSFHAVVDYLRLRMAEETRERFVVLFLDRKNRLIRDEVMSEGTIDHAPVYPREVMRRALELSAANIIISHQHPSGDPSPSEADIVMTKKIVAAGKALGIGVHDHVIIGRTGHVSLTMKGLM